MMKDPMKMEKEDWKSLLKADPTDWLLDKGNIVIRYRALKEIVGNVREAQRLKPQLANYSGTRGILLNQLPSGGWKSSDSLRPYSGTPHKLNLLADFGITVEDKRIKKAVDFVMSFRDEASGQFLPYRDRPKQCAANNLAGYLVRSLLLLGVSEEEMGRTLQGIINRQKANGGWQGSLIGECRRRETGVFLSGTVNVLWGLLESEEHCQGPAARRAGDFVLEHIFEERTDCCAVKAHIERGKLRYPQFWYDYLKVLETVSQIGFKLDDNRVETLVSWLLDQQKDNGCWDGYRGRKVVVDDAWVTLKAIVVIKRLCQARG